MVEMPCYEFLECGVANLGNRRAKSPLQVAQVHFELVQAGNIYCDLELLPMGLKAEATEPTLDCTPSPPQDKMR